MSYQAKATEARLEIWVSFSEGLKKEIEEALNSIAKAEETLPLWARNPYQNKSFIVSFHPQITKEVDNVSRKDLLTEFERKAKKMGFSQVKPDISVTTFNDGMLFHTYAKGRV